MEFRSLHQDSDIRYKGRIVSETDLEAYFFKTFRGKFKIVDLKTKQTQGSEIFDHICIYEFIKSLMLRF